MQLYMLLLFFLVFSYFESLYFDGFGAFICLFGCICIHICMHICIHIHAVIIDAFFSCFSYFGGLVRSYDYVYVYVYIFACIYVYIYIYMHS